MALRAGMGKIMTDDQQTPPRDDDDKVPEIGPIELLAEYKRRIARENAHFKLVAFNDVRLDEDADDIIKGLFPSSGLVVVWGPPKCGKSFWTFDVLMHIALARTYRGHRVTQGPIVYCALEGVRGFKRRIEAFRQAKMTGEEAAAPPPFYLMPASLSLVADHESLIADIRAQLGDQRPAAARTSAK